MRIFRVPGQQRALMETQFAPWGPEAQMIQGSTSGVLGGRVEHRGQKNMDRWWRRRAYHARRQTATVLWKLAKLDEM